MTGQYMGIRIVKFSSDTMQYQELIWKLRPKVIVECGTRFGGSALFFAHMMELMKIPDAKVITIDITDEEYQAPEHPLIHRLIGSSVDPAIFSKVVEGIGKLSPVLISLDSEHTTEHVLNELNLYHKLVTKGSYLIVEDTNQLGPRMALYKFLSEHPEFVPDTIIQPVDTSNPSGYLLRV